MMGDFGNFGQNFHFDYQLTPYVAYLHIYQVLALCGLSTKYWLIQYVAYYEVLV